MNFIFSISWILLFLVIIASITVFISQFKFRNWNLNLLYNQTQLSRDVSYTSQLLQEKQFTKEIRLFRLAEHLKNRWSKNHIKNGKETLTLFKRQKKD